MTKPGRIACEVLGCRRTAPAARYEEGTRIICGKCWRLGSAEARTAHRVAKRELTRLGASPEPASIIRRSQWEWAAHDAWERIVTEASEARAGIA